MGKLKEPPKPRIVDLNLQCEHCGPMPPGTKMTERNGATWCPECYKLIMTDDAW